MKKFIAIMFLIIFTFQVMPVKALGKLLAKAQTTEEVHDDAGTGAGGKVQKFNGEDILLSLHFGNTSAQVLHFKNKIRSIIHRAEALPPALIADVQSPPPDSK